MSKVDVEELERLYRQHLPAQYAGVGVTQWNSAIREQWPALLAELRAARAVVEAARRVLARDAQWSLSGAKNDCGCIRLSRTAEREYEAEKCPHQLARKTLTAYDALLSGDKPQGSGEE